MKLILHIVGKDWRRWRWPWLGWLALVVAKYVIGYGVVFDLLPSRWLQSPLDVTVYLMQAAEVVLVFFFTALVVQNDNLVGTTQFWVTRPVSGVRLLASKLLGLVLLVIMPAIALAVPWWITCGFDSSLMAMAAIELLAWQLLAIAPAFLVASLTNTLGRFLMWSVVLLWLVIMAPFYVTIAVAKIASAAKSSAEIVTAERMLVTTVVFGLVACAVVVLQFRTRRWVRSVLVLVGGATVALSVGALWPSNVFGGASSAAKPPFNEARGAALAFEWKRAGAERVTSAVEDVKLRTYWNVSKIPGRQILIGQRASTEVRWSDGTARVAQGQVIGDSGHEQAFRELLGLRPAKPDPETEEWLREERRRKKFPGRPEAAPSHNLTVLTFAPGSVVSRLQRESARMEHEIHLELWEPRVLHETKVRPGPWLAHSGRGFRFLRVDEKATSTPLAPMYQVLLVDSVPHYLLDPFSWVVRRHPELDRWWYWYGRGGLVHRPSGVSSFRYYFGTRCELRVASVMLGVRGGSLDAPRWVREGRWVPVAADWIDTASMVTVGWSPVARFTRKLAIEEFPVLKK